jgi:hypothetical protein
MITETDALSTVELKDYYVILPSTRPWDMERFVGEFGGKMCEPGFRYSSGENDDWLTVEQLRELIREHVDPSFEV